MRFRKSVRLCKGLKVNFSKSGASFTTGIPGFSLTSGKKGVYLNTGIPGTGLYNRTKLGSSSGSSENRRGPAKKRTVSTKINLHMDDNGAMTFAYANGRAITDDATIRKIKTTPQYKSEKERMQKEHDNDIAHKVLEFNQNAESFININKFAAKVESEGAYKTALENHKQRFYTAAQYTVPAPTEENVKKRLLQEAKQQIKSALFWTLKEKHDQYINENFDKEFARSMDFWKNEKQKFDEEQLQIQTSKNAEFEKEYLEKRAALEAALYGDECYIGVAIGKWLEDVELPVNCGIQYQYNAAKQTLYIDADLPEIEDMPNEKACQLSSGNMKIGKKTQKEIKEEYATCVFGIAIFFASHLFNVSPQILSIVFSGYTQRRNSKGEMNDDYIFSVIFSREKFESSDLIHVNPYNFCMCFQNRCNLTQTMLFKIIEPYEAEATDSVQ